MSSKLPLSDALKRLAANEEKFEGIINGAEGHEEDLGGKMTPSLRTIFSQITSAAFLSECVQRACACAKHWAFQANKIATEDAVIATGSTEARSLPDRFADVVNVLDFGAKGDGVTDDTSAIQAAAVAAKNSGKILFATGSFYVTDTITLQCSCSMGTAKIYAHGASVSPVVQVGGNSNETNTKDKTIELPEVHNLDDHDLVWSGLKNSVGVLLDVVNHCDVVIPFVYQFYTNVKIAPENGLGCAYNRVYVRRTWNGVQNILLLSDENAGWPNQNVIFVGRLQMDSSVGGLDPVQVTIDNKATSGFGPNNNVFLGGCFESNVCKYNILCSGSYNQFLGCRFEGNYKVHFKAENGQSVFDNVIIGGYNVDKLTFSVEESGTGKVGSGLYLDGAAAKLGLFTAPFSLGQRLANYPHIRGYADKNIYETKNDDTDWEWQLGHKGLELKNKNVSAPLLSVLYDGVSFFSSSDALSEYPVGFGAYFSTDSEIIGNIFVRGAIKSFYPYNDNSVSCGTGGHRWSQVYAASGSINTSDANEKQSIETYPDAVLDAWGEVELCQFLFKDSVKKKGESARIHAGIIAQQVVEAFLKYGLDATRYGLLCYDAWNDEYETVEVIDSPAEFDADGNELSPAQTHTERRLVMKAGDRYGIRYSEALCLEAAYQRRRADRLEARIAALEAKLK